MERTFVIIKPDAIQNKLVGEIIKRIENENLQVVHAKTSLLKEEHILELYRDSLKKFPQISTSIVEYMTSSKSLLLIVQGQDAIKKTRSVRGDSDPSSSPVGSVRRDYAGDQKMSELTASGKVTKNIMHASGSKEEAEFEINLFFGKNDF